MLCEDKAPPGDVSTSLFHSLRKASSKHAGTGRKRDVSPVPTRLVDSDNRKICATDNCDQRRILFKQHTQNKRIAFLHRPPHSSDLEVTSRNLHHESTIFSAATTTAATASFLLLHLLLTLSSPEFREDWRLFLDTADTKEWDALLRQASFTKSL